MSFADVASETSSLPFLQPVPAHVHMRSYTHAHLQSLHEAAHVNTTAPGSPSCRVPCCHGLPSYSQLGDPVSALFSYKKTRGGMHKTEDCLYQTTKSHPALSQPEQGVEELPLEAGCGWEGTEYMTRVKTPHLRDVTHQGEALPLGIGHGVWRYCRLL